MSKSFRHNYLCCVLLRMAGHGTTESLRTVHPSLFFSRTCDKNAPRDGGATCQRGRQGYATRRGARRGSATQNPRGVPSWPAPLAARSRPLPPATMSSTAARPARPASTTTRTAAPSSNCWPATATASSGGCTLCFPFPTPPGRQLTPTWPPFRTAADPDRSPQMATVFHWNLAGGHFTS